MNGLAVGHKGAWHPWLVLARVSNLPTVWSNCLAAWLLGGAGPVESLACVVVGASLLYTGGMFLNDAFDSAYDATHRRERPIPSGQVTRKTVALCGTGLICVGWLCFTIGGNASSAWSGGLVLAIVLYDALHKHTAGAPLLMALCRFLLYCAAASASLGRNPAPAFGPALAMASYIAGLSYLARGESKAQKHQPSWAFAFVLVPIGVKAAHCEIYMARDFVPMLVFAVWIGWLLWHVLKGRKPLAAAVPGLLAGIVLVDWLLSSPSSLAQATIFGMLFVLALLLQRFVPST